MVKNLQSGNVLFIILIAVALFAALSFTISSTSRNSSDGRETTQTRAELMASQIAGFVSNLQSAYTRLRITNGCSVGQLSFDSPLTPSWQYENVNSPSDGSCHFFRENGGGIVPARAADLTRASAITYTATCAISGVENSIVAAFAVDLDTCVIINQRFGFNSPSHQPTAGAFHCTATGFTGSNTANAGLISVAAGSRIGCYQVPTSSVLNPFIIGSGPIPTYWAFFTIGRDS